MPKKISTPILTLLARIIVALLLLSIINVPLGTTTQAAPADCADIETIFARGSGEPLDGTNYRAYRQALDATFTTYAPSLTLSHYELGSGGYAEASYPAVAADTPIDLTGTVISLGYGFAFGDSIKAGVAELTGYLDAKSASCPNTKYIIAGYSQGATVISQALSKISHPAQILYAATVADPKIYLPEGLTSIPGATPPACRGQNLSIYRANVPDCTVSAGILRATKPYASGYGASVGTWCHQGDSVCGSFPSLGAVIDNGILAQHLTYNADGTYVEVAHYAINAAKAVFAEQIVETIPVISARRDTVVVIDSTGSMADLFNQYRAEALKVARNTLNQGGRVALYEYRDQLNEDFAPKQLCDFSCSYTEFERALDNITLDGGGDEPESALSALLQAMNELTWQQGATKSMVLLTDATYHATDINGVTLPQVVQRSREIDPVNIYIMTKPGLATTYRELAEQTEGDIFTDTADYLASTTLLTSRPHARLALARYLACPGEEIHFDATSSAAGNEIVRYEWDLDFDGTYEVTTTTPVISKTYTVPISGLMRVKVVDQDGLSSDATAAVIILDPAVGLPTIYAHTVEYSDKALTTITLEATEASSFILTMGETFLGFSTNNVLRLTNLPVDETELTIIPLNENGLPGAAYVVQLNKEGRGNGTNPSEHLPPKAPATGAKFSSD